MFSPTLVGNELSSYRSSGEVRKSSYGLMKLRALSEALGKYVCMYLSKHLIYHLYGQKGIKN